MSTPHPAHPHTPWPAASALADARASGELVGAPSTRSSLPEGWLLPNWRVSAPPSVVACMTARAGGVSQAPWAACNLGDHVGDDLAAVQANRLVAARALARLGADAAAVDAAGAAPTVGRGADPVWPVGWLKQVHGAVVHRLRATDFPVQEASGCVAQADGVFTTEPGLVCAVMVADCLPILLATPDGRGVAALHAGWRGLAGASPAMQGRGIVEAGVHALCEATGCDPAGLLAWLGPCIGPQQFQVGGDVCRAWGLEGSVRDMTVAARTCFSPDAPDADGTPRWLADLAGLARLRLRALGVRQVSGGDWCTASDGARFFSYRRDGVTGRQAAMIALRPPVA